ncbi:hypothetical protein [Campylobacter sp. 19-13652]|uniref:hypothetical protein n=1 Tax=Campylobacter sp. 19-13652 TaxID=2840180 RepID=UPI001C76B68F|nr:hypothetical protein [Campylobacter sp. 19-13652]BCX79239.1 hypothetical protein LBC_07010 [Campylobacter sp. 19-13652]
MNLVKFNNVELEILEFKDSWSLSNKQVAEGFGVDEATIRQQKSRGEYLENVHFYTVTNCHGGADRTFWTKKGVVTLGFKLRETPQTIAFRDWASDYIIQPKLSIKDLAKNPDLVIELATNLKIEQEKSKALEQQRDEALAAKAWIGSKREATAMATASSATREVERLKIKLDLSKDYASIKKVAKATGKHEKDYSWRLLKGVSEALGLERKNVDDENYGEVKAYHKQAWREAYGVDITRI